MYDPDLLFRELVLIGLVAAGFVVTDEDGGRCFRRR